MEQIPNFYVKLYAHFCTMANYKSDVNTNQKYFEIFKNLKRQLTILSKHVCMHIQSCPTLCGPVGCSPPGFSVHGILPARILEWVAISYLRRCSWSRNWTQVSCVSLHWQSDSLPLSHLGSHKPYASLAAQRLKRLPAMQETWVRSLGQ